MREGRKEGDGQGEQEGKKKRKKRKGTRITNGDKPTAERELEPERTLTC